MISRYASFVLVIIGAVLQAACQVSPGVARPAVLLSTDTETMIELKATIGQALGRARIELGPGDLTTTSTVSVLPPPLGEFETHSLAKPVLFNLSKKGRTCRLTHQQTGEVFVLDKVTCQAVDE
ncbi:MAG: hypothetical protein Hens3KO_26930 [Henriciella sp.]